MAASIFKGRAALITGGGTGIGRGIALAFAREGGAVALAGRRKEPLQETVAEIEKLGAKACAIASDVTLGADCQRMVHECVERFGGLHVLVNNAGFARFGMLDMSSEDDIRNTLKINLEGAILLTKYAVPELTQHPGQACVLNISSGVANQAVKNFSVYAAAKAGLVHFTQCLALDLAPQRVRANCINPGVIETPIFETMMPKAKVAGALVNFAKQTPLGRVGQPDDVANAALFLCGPQAEWITGAVLTVDGGLSLA